MRRALWSDIQVDDILCVQVVSCDVIGMIVRLLCFDGRGHRRQLDWLDSEVKLILLFSKWILILIPAIELMPTNGGGPPDYHRKQLLKGIEFWVVTASLLLYFSVRQTCYRRTTESTAAVDDWIWYSECVRWRSTTIGKRSFSFVYLWVNDITM